MRVSGFEEAKTEVIGAPESAMFASAGLGLGIMGTYLLGKVGGRKPQNVCVHTVDPASLARIPRTQVELPSGDCAGSSLPASVSIASPINR